MPGKTDRSFSRRRRASLGSMLALCLSVVATIVPAQAENIDPAGDNSRFAWGENVGWINAQPSGAGGPGLEVHDFELIGWLWAENLGWISASCKNTASCDDVSYGVENDGRGNLRGTAWAENAGWINFNPETVAVGVTIDPSTGEFAGMAWSENFGWIVFDADPAGNSAMRTSWTCDPPPPVPTSTPELLLAGPGPATLLSWSQGGDTTGDDVLIGDLGTLRASGGNFGTAIQACLSENNTSSALSYAATPSPGQAYWFVVRPVNCGGNGSYDTGLGSQAAGRDATLAGSAVACQ